MSCLGSGSVFSKTMSSDSDDAFDVDGDNLDLDEDPTLIDMVPSDEDSFEDDTQLLREDELGSSSTVKETKKEAKKEEEETRPMKDYVVAALA